ncbi:hypothetical protein T4B_913 [Trichinella pseudospiralis]|uniref:Uncharacterized protein n=2 Tax=Trichinella pseudospiralis TaxID=6337 RepID=A0A0V1FYG2_TRIPS|nr:hypothetical protein T4D_5567 [Trichinella pseudospiralis]KRZ24488.1 hypothetical protein T4B_913 [Trichinella pseudospiralis]
MEEWLKFNRSIREIRVRAKRASGTRQSVRNENPAAGTSDSEWAARLLRYELLKLNNDQFQSI